jgi:hypothetical protein
MFYSMLYFILNVVVLINACPFDEYNTVALTYNLESVNVTQNGDDDTYKEWCVSDEPNLKVVQSLKNIAKRLALALADGTLMKNVQETIVDNYNALNNEEITFSRKGKIILTLFIFLIPITLKFC